MYTCVCRLYIKCTFMNNCILTDMYVHIFIYSYCNIQDVPGGLYTVLKFISKKEGLPPLARRYGYDRYICMCIYVCIHVYVCVDGMYMYIRRYVHVYVYKHMYS